MRRFIVVLAALSLAAGSLAAQSDDQLLPARKRITDEALARDWALIQKWLARADSLPRGPGDAYARARAIALLEFVGTEYDRANRSPVLDSSFVHAVSIVRRIEAGQTWYETVHEPTGVEAVAPGLWHAVDSLQAADVNHCAEAEIARAQVKLLLAVEEHRTGGPQCSAPIVQDVTVQVAEIERLMAACAPRLADTVSGPSPVPAVEPAAPRPEVVKIPAQVHFAFDRAALSPPTRRVLDQLATQLRALPQAQVKLDAFADPQGQATYNQQLSARRGEAVRDYLVANGVDPARISVVPLGASSPLGTAGLPRLESYALDRRVDIRILPMPNILVERYEQYADVQVTRDPRRSRGRARPSSRDQAR